MFCRKKGAGCVDAQCESPVALVHLMDEASGVYSGGRNQAVGYTKVLDAVSDGLSNTCLAADIAFHA